MTLRLVRAAALVACALALACDDAPTVTGIAGVPGASDVTLAGDLVFVTATDNNELRVIDLAPAEGERPGFVRAPNPLSPLSIPVAGRPIELARDVIWENGQENGRHWVFSRAANGREISIVAATEDRLVEVGVVRSTEEITAIAGRGTPAGAATLYVATYDGSRSRIWGVPIPAPGAAAADFPTGLADTTAIAAADEQCSAVLSMLVLPNNQLAYSVRRTPALETTCLSGTTDERLAAGQLLRAASSVLLDLSSGARTVLEFGTPVRELFTNPAWGSRPEALRIYGIIDERVCELGDKCRGVLAVEGPSFQGNIHEPVMGALCGGAVGKIACDFAGLPMLPVTAGAALVMGASVGVGQVSVPDYARKAPASELVGVLARSDGTLQFWDAEHLYAFDVSPDGAGGNQPAGAAQVVSLGPDLVSIPYKEGPVPNSIGLGEGVARDEQLRIMLGGTLADFAGLPVPADPLATVLSVPVSPIGQVAVDDEVRVDPNTACPETIVRVTAVDATTVTVAAPLGVPPVCSYSIRPALTGAAASAEPWVVTGTQSGYLGRFAAPPVPAELRFPEDPARVEALRFAHVGAGQQPDALIVFQFVDPLGRAPAGADRGLVYLIDSRSNFVRAAVAFDAAAAANRDVFVRVAGPVLFRPGTAELIVTYPSEDAVLRVDTANVSVTDDIALFDPFL